MTEQKDLLAVIELGGYPDFSGLYRTLGYNVHQVTSVRKAIRELKKLTPRVIVAEFNFQSDFRDRTSSLESLMSTLQGSHAADVIVFYEKEYEHQLQRLAVQYPLFATLPFPIDESLLTQQLERLSSC